MLTAEYRIVLYAVALLIGLAIFVKVRSRGARQAVLLIGSYALYATWGLWFAAVLLASTVMNFLFGRWLRRKPSALVLWIGIICNLLLLGSFKYLPGFAASLPFASLQQFAHIALPLGISFWTFQAMSYLFDLYRGEELDPTCGSSRCTWRSSRSRSPGRSAACPTCCRSSAPKSRCHAATWRAGSAGSQPAR